MSDMLKKLEYLNETKSSITNSLTKKGVVIPDNTPFREYYKLIDDIGKNDFADKEFLIEVLLGKKPELEGVITINSSLRDIANQFMTIGAINLKFKEVIDCSENFIAEKSEIPTYIPSIVENLLCNKINETYGSISEDLSNIVLCSFTTKGKPSYNSTHTLKENINFEIQ